MTIPAHITKDVGGTVTIDLLDRESTAPTVIVEDASGGEVSSGNSTVSTVATTISADADRGSRVIAVASATGISAGVVIWLQDDPEAVLVRSVSGTTINLRRPLIKDHVSGATCEGTRCSYDVSAGEADKTWWDGRVQWTLDSGDILYTAIECTLYPLTRHATVQDLYDRKPSLYEVMDPERDAERLLDNGFEEVLQRIGARARVRVFTGSPSFVQATVLAALMLHYEGTTTEDGIAAHTRYDELLDSEIARVTATTPRDADQDGTISESDRMSYRSVHVSRR